LTHMATKATAVASTESGQSTKSAYEEYVKPQWVSLLTLLGLNEEYERCEGTELYAKDGRKVLDFLSGYCVHNTGHNHPYIVQALKDELDKTGPAMLLSLARRAAKI
jgi:ornithine--oxo-acid transaminase